MALTEVDVTNASTSQYAGLTQACMNVPRCVGITTWGIRDSDSWRGSENPLLFDRNSNPKAAYTAVLNALNAAPTTTSVTTPPTTPSTTAPTGACTATFRMVNTWPGGFQDEVTVANTGPATFSGWTAHLTPAVDRLFLACGTEPTPAPAERSASATPATTVPSPQRLDRLRIHGDRQQQHRAH